MAEYEQPDGSYRARPLSEFVPTPDPITPDRCGVMPVEPVAAPRFADATGTPTTPDRVTASDVDAMARVLMAAWEAAEGRPVKASYVATFADMARAVLLSDSLRAAQADAFDQGWDERDNDCGDPYSPHRTNPYRGHDD